MKVMIAGIAGASLGTEMAKALHLVGGYTVFGCDISPLAYGHYDPHFSQTFVLDSASYIQSLVAICKNHNIKCLIAGAEKTMGLIAENAAVFEAEGVVICQNSPDVVAVCSNKETCFDTLARMGVPIPMTRRIHAAADLEGFPVPCVIKPALDSGGSSYVFYAATRADAELYCAYLTKNDKVALAQEYISHDQGEFTVGVLSLNDGVVVSSIALKRSFASKLSVAAQGHDFLISSGYSQGEIRDFPHIRKVAEAIAQAIGSTGPINVQGRVRADGTFVPFEINPRFSATTFLRAMAGFNEIDYLIKDLCGVAQDKPMSVKEGWYLRSLDQIYTKELIAVT